MKTINEVKLLVGDNRVEDALDSLLEIIGDKDDTLTNQLLLTKGRFKEYTLSTNLGLEERNHERQQIVNSILILADDAEQYVATTNPATPKTPAMDVSIKGDAEIVGVIYMHMYAYTTNDFKIMQLTLHPDYSEAKPAEWKEFLKKNAGDDIAFEITKIEPLSADTPKVTYTMEYLRKSTLTPPAFETEWASDIISLMHDDKKRWKIVYDENLEFKILK